MQFMHCRWLSKYSWGTKEKKNFSPSIISPQINHQGKLNNIEKVSITFVNVQQDNTCVKRFLLMVEVSRQTKRKWELEREIHKQRD